MDGASAGLKHLADSEAYELSEAHARWCLRRSSIPTWISISPKAKSELESSLKSTASTQIRTEVARSHKVYETRVITN